MITAYKLNQNTVSLTFDKTPPLLVGERVFIAQYYLDGVVSAVANVVSEQDGIVKVQMEDSGATRVFRMCLDTLKPLMLMDVLGKQL